MTRLHRLAIVVALALACGVAAGAASAFSWHTYFGPSWTAYYGYQYQSGWNYPQTNRVYRPLYYYFTVWYTDDVTVWGYKRNYTDNPLVWPYAGGYAKSACIYSDDVIQGSLYPVTCQYATTA